MKDEGLRKAFRALIDVSLRRRNLTTADANEVLSNIGEAVPEGTPGGVSVFNERGE